MDEDEIDELVLEHLDDAPLMFGDLMFHLHSEEGPELKPSAVRTSLVRLGESNKVSLIHGEGWYRL